MRKTVHKSLALLIVLALVTSLVPGAMSLDPEDVHLASIEHTRVPITDASFDDYFGGDAEAGVRALLDEGAVYINGRQVPYMVSETEYSAASLMVNGFTALEPLGNGSWRWDVHASVRGTASEGTELENFNTARISLVSGASMMLGFTMELRAPQEGAPASKLLITLKSAAQVTGVSIDGDNTIVAGTEHNGSRGYGPGLTADTFPTDNVTGDIEAEDIVLFWQDERDGNAGWNIERATPTSGLLIGSIDGTDPQNLELTFTFNGEQIPQAVLRRDGLATAVRPTQFLKDHERDNRLDDEVLIWTTDTGHIIAISYKKVAPVDKSALEAAIKGAEEALDGVVVSLDGNDVWTTQRWMVEAVMRIMQQRVADAWQVYDTPTATQAEVDAAAAEVTAVGLAVNSQATAGKRTPFDDATQAQIIDAFFETSNRFVRLGTNKDGLPVVGGAVAGNDAAAATTVQDLIDDFVASAGSVEDLTGLIAVVIEHVDGQTTDAAANTPLGTEMIIVIQTGGTPIKMIIVVENDLNGDGVVDEQDLTAMANEMQTPGTLSQEQILAAAIPDTHETSALNMLSVLIRLSSIIDGNVE